MIYLPDTNVFSLHLRGQDEVLSATLVKALGRGEVVLSLVVASELNFGAEKARLMGNPRPANRLKTLFTLLPIEPLPVSAAAHYGLIRALLEQRGEGIGNMDLLLASHALAADAVLVTRNVREFSRVPDLACENWQTA